MEQLRASPPPNSGDHRLIAESKVLRQGRVRMVSADLLSVQQAEVGARTRKVFDEMGVLEYRVSKAWLGSGREVVLVVLEQGESVVREGLGHDESCDLEQDDDEDGDYMD